MTPAAVSLLLVYLKRAGNDARKTRMTLEQELEAGLAQLGLELSAEQIDRLNQHLALLNKMEQNL